MSESRDPAPGYFFRETDFADFVALRNRLTKVKIKTEFFGNPAVAIHGDVTQGINHFVGKALFLCQALTSGQ